MAAQAGEDSPAKAIAFYEQAIEADPFDSVLPRACQASRSNRRFGEARSSRAATATCSSPLLNPRHSGEPPEAPKAPHRRQHVSLTMIVKNEEANLAACLNSVVDLVTRLSSSTPVQPTEPSTSRLNAARIVHFTWCDDFAAARNAAIEAAHGEWILWLDADERLGPTSRVKARQLFSGLRTTRTPAISCASFRNRPIHGIEHGGRSEHNCSEKNRPDVRSDYRIHEQILIAIRRAHGAVRSTEEGGRRRSTIPATKTPISGSENRNETRPCSKSRMPRNRKTRSSRSISLGYIRTQRNLCFMVRPQWAPPVRKDCMRRTMKHRFRLS